MAAAARKVHLRDRRDPTKLKLVPKNRNNRVRRRKRGWAKARLAKLDTSITFAEAASAHRRALQVTAREVADEYGVTAQAVYHWESGLFMSWTDKALQEYQRVCNRIAG
jgi:DNA-binding XRE family transcriptional regulator